MRVEFFKDENGMPLPAYPDPSQTFSSALWDFKGTAMSIGNITYVVGKPVSDLLEYELIIERDPQTYILKYIFPLFFIAFASTLTYWIDPTVVPARVGFSVSLLLATITLNFVVSQDLPKVNYATKLDTYIGVIFIFVFASMVEFAIIHYWRQVGKDANAFAFEQVFRYTIPTYLLLWTIFVFLPGNSGDLDPPRIIIIVLSVLILAGIILLFDRMAQQDTNKIV